MPLNLMYNRATVAKSQVKGRYDEIVAFYRPGWQKTLEEEDFMERHMQQSIKKNELHFFMEPIVSLDCGKIGAAMALARWRIPNRPEALSMEQFIPVFRKNGFIYQFDRFLFESACQAIAHWQKNGSPLIPIVVNMSNELLYDADFVQRLTAKTAQYGVPNQLLIIELTETARTDFLPQLQRAGEELRKAGFGLTVHYEGKGVTLSNIFQHLPIEGIKVTPNIWTPDASSKQQVIAKAITDICRQLGIFLAADGAQTKEDLEHIKQLGFQFVQGAAAAPEVDSTQLAKLLTDQAAKEKPAN